MRVCACVFSLILWYADDKIWFSFSNHCKCFMNVTFVFIYIKCSMIKKMSTHLAVSNIRIYIAKINLRMK